MTLHHPAIIWGHWRRNFPKLCRREMSQLTSVVKDLIEHSFLGKTDPSTTWGWWWNWFKLHSVIYPPKRRQSDLKAIKNWKEIWEVRPQHDPEWNDEENGLTIFEWSCAKSSECRLLFPNEQRSHSGFKRIRANDLLEIGRLWSCYSWRVCWIKRHAMHQCTFNRGWIERLFTSDEFKTLNKCSRQCCDRCSTMTGHRNGLVVQIKKKEKRALYTNS